MSGTTKKRQAAALADFELRKKLFSLQVRVKVDPRQIACEVQAVTDGETVVVNGFSQFAQTDTYIRKIATEVFAGSPVDFHLKILTKGQPCDL